MMKLLTSVRRLRLGVRSFALAPASKRHYSESSTQSDLYDRLTTRPPNYIFDYLSPTPSHLLNIALADILPEECYPAGFKTSNLTLPTHPYRTRQDDATSPLAALPQGHHLVYFPPQVLGKDLLPDGTDPLQSPGPPFLRRMWAGGSLVYPTSSTTQLDLRRRRSVCRESISDVSVKGTEDAEKVFVTVERRITKPTDIVLNGFKPRYTAVLERRNLVFFREMTSEAALERAGRPDKVLMGMHVHSYVFFIHCLITDSLTMASSLEIQRRHTCPNHAHQAAPSSLLSSLIQRPWHSSRSSVLSRSRGLSKSTRSRTSFPNPHAICPEEPDWIRHSL